LLTFDRVALEDARIGTGVHARTRRTHGATVRRARHGCSEGKRLDTGTAGAAGGCNSTLEALGTLDRTKVTPR